MLPPSKKMKIEDLLICYGTETKSVLSLSKYYSLFIPLLSATVKRVRIDNLKISQSEFENIISSCYLVEELNFDMCDIDSENAQFDSTLFYKMKSLCFGKSGYGKWSNWKKNPKKFKGILKAISGCLLKNKLKGVYWDGKFFESKLGKWAEEFGIKRLLSQTYDFTF